jgi:hypothetical protein
MPVYTVHEPPRGTRDPASDLERIAFVRDGFHFWAFVLAPVWMIRHALWLALAVYIVVMAGVDIGLAAIGASAFAMVVVGVLIALLVGLEAGTLRRAALSLRGWTSAGIVSGSDLEDAERRFFATQVRDELPRRDSDSPGPPGQRAEPPPIPRSPHLSGIVGLFPEPGA